MNTAIFTGGPAFPVSGTLETGLTRRDYFAANAMQSLMTGDTLQKLDKVLQDEDKVFALVAKSAYAMADAMLKAREVGHD